MREAPDRRGQSSPDERTIVVERAEQLWQTATRREFLRLLGMGGAILLAPSLFTACDDADDLTRPFGPLTLDLGSDTGILNVAYALEQLEAAFYVKAVASTAFSGMSAEQQEVMTDLRDHEVAHRQLLAAALGGARIGTLALNEATMAEATASASAILEHAEALEELGVAAYDGIGKYLQSGDNLLLVAKIVSVEARHAAAIRDLREGMGLSGTPPNTRFAGDDVVAAQGLDVTLEPADVLARVAETHFLTRGLAIGTPPSVGGSGGSVTDALSFALILEIFQNELYEAVLGTSTSAAQNLAFAPVRAKLSPAATAAMRQMRKHQAAHVAFLTANGAANPLGLGADSFDFTGNRGGAPGPFARATSELDFLLALMQGIEDTGVRAYAGQAASLVASPVLLEAALRIRSVEARHASKIRRLRRAGGAPAVVKYSGTVSGGGAAAAGVGGITPEVDDAVVAAFEAIYAGEDATTQAGVDVTRLGGLPSGFGAAAASEAFDEPLTRAQVLAVVQPFFKPALS